VDVKVKLVPSKDSFNIRAHEGASRYKSIITPATLVVRKAKLKSAVYLEHEKTPMKGNVKYPLKQTTLKTFIPKRMLSQTQDNLFFSETPTRIDIGIVTSAAFNGSYKANQFNLKHFDLPYLNITADERTVSGKPLSMDYSHNQYVRAFFGTNIAMGLIGKNVGNDLEYRHLKNGYTLYAV
jgi:hypothetical protein